MVWDPTKDPPWGPPPPEPEGPVPPAPLVTKGGFCQALFRRHDVPGDHTAFVVCSLEEAGATRPLSHELFYGYLGPDYSIEEFFRSAVGPLKLKGEVPVLITSFEADAPKVQDIFRIETRLRKTILVRVLVSQRSVEAAAGLLRSCVDAFNGKRQTTHPKWWPLFQLQGDEDAWKTLKCRVGSAWEYMMIAVNPFSRITDDIIPRIVIAQIPIGAADGVGSTMRLAPGVKITGASDSASYDLSAYIRQVRQLPRNPIFIVLGPTKPEWDDQENVVRVSRTLDLLRADGIML